MSLGNWGSIPDRRTRGSRRKRIVLSVAAAVVLVALVYLSIEFAGPSLGDLAGYVIGVGLLLIAGVLLDLQPWRRDR